MSRDPGAAVAAAATADPSKAQHGALREWAQQYSVETEPLGRGSFASVSDKRERERESGLVGVHVYLVR